jgi:hypothetical protein
MDRSRPRHAGPRREDGRLKQLALAGKGRPRGQQILLPRLAPSLLLLKQSPLLAGAVQPARLCHGGSASPIRSVTRLCAGQASGSTWQYRQYDLRTYLERRRHDSCLQLLCAGGGLSWGRLAAPPSTRRPAPLPPTLPSLVSCCTAGCTACCTADIVIASVPRWRLPCALPEARSSGGLCLPGPGRNQDRRGGNRVRAGATFRGPCRRPRSGPGHLVALFLKGGRSTRRLRQRWSRQGLLQGLGDPRAGRLRVS